ncbi:MAG: hypothetical protein AAGC74_09700 [Verrucomicrobiota bacterium]
MADDLPNAPQPAGPAPPPLPPSPLEKLNDFSDRLSPMLVKELRQGLRANSFVIVFLMLQGLLGLILLTTAAAASSSESIDTGPFISGIIFYLFSLAVLIVQPLRGMSAISGEIKADTIDLMVLTRLSSWRIVFGKWTSIVGQSALILLAIIPYLILRYFFGGMQLFSELLLLFSVFLLSALFTAFTVGLSATSHILLRIIPLLGAALIFIPIFTFSFTEFDSILEFFSPKSTEHWLAFLASYIILIYLTYFFLEVAATSISPDSENRATRKRLIGFLAVVVAFLGLIFVNEPAAASIAFLILALLSLDVFTERFPYPSSVTEPFVRRGPLGNLAGRLLYPGWPTGILFHTLLFALIFLPFVALQKQLKPHEAWESVGFAFGFFHFPLALLNLFEKRIKNRFTIYLTVQILLLGLTPLVFVLSNSPDNDIFFWLFSFIPQFQLGLTSEINPPPSLAHTLIWGTPGLCSLFNHISARPQIPTHRQLRHPPRP